MFIVREFVCGGCWEVSSKTEAIAIAERVKNSFRSYYGVSLNEEDMEILPC